MPEHYEQEDFAKLETATSFEDLVDIALTILRRIKKEGHEVVQICGPSRKSILVEEYPVEWLR